MNLTDKKKVLAAMASSDNNKSSKSWAITDKTTASTSVGGGGFTPTKFMQTQQASSLQDIAQTNRTHDQQISAAERQMLHILGVLQSAAIQLLQSVTQQNQNEQQYDIHMGNIQSIHALTYIVGQLATIQQSILQYSQNAMMNAQTHQDNDQHNKQAQQNIGQQTMTAQAFRDFAAKAPQLDWLLREFLRIARQQAGLRGTTDEYSNEADDGKRLMENLIKTLKLLEELHHSKKINLRFPSNNGVNDDLLARLKILYNNFRSLGLGF